MVTAATVFRDYETDGIPASGKHKVKKPDVRQLLAGFESIISAFTSNGGLIYTSKAQMDADLLHGSKSSAWVVGDPTLANNGIYQKQGASGSGSWTRVADLPYSFIIASDVGAGTPNAIQVTTSIPVSGSALVWMNVFEANTSSPVTVSFNGGTVLTLKTNTGNNIVAGGLVAGMIMLGIVAGSTFRLVSDQTSAAIVAAAEAAQVAAEAAQAGAEAAAASTNAVLANSLRVDQAQTFDPTQKERGRNNLGLAQVAETWLGVSDWNTATISGWYFGGSGTLNAPDSSDYVVQVIAGGGGYAQQFARAFGVDKEFVRERVSGTFGSWVPRKGNDITAYGAVGNGVTNAQAAIEAAIAAQTGRIIGTAAFSSIPQAPVVDITIPGGVWHVAGLVDTGNKNVTYNVSENAVFTSGSVDNLNSAKIVRKNRTTSNFVSGVLDSATGRSTMVGDGAADRSPLVSGITNINQIGTVDTFDAVADYTDITGVALLHTSAATFTSANCTLAVAAPVKKLRVGMVVLTSNNYAAQILSWNAGGTVITVTGWFPLGNTTPGTPAAATVYFNPISEIYARNTNVFLPSIGYTYQGTAHEMGLINNKVEPTTAEDPAGKTWMSDVVNLGGYRGSIGHISRGDWWEGFRATGTQKGFVAKGYATLGYAAPLVGFEYEGPGNALVARDAAGTAMAYIEASVGRILAQRLVLFNLKNATNDAAAAAAGVPVGEVYRNGSVLMIRVT